MVFTFKRPQRAADSSPRSSLAPASTALVSSPSSSAALPSQLYTQASTPAQMHPLLVPEIVSEVFGHLEDDLWSVAQSTEVCRLWWQVGHKRVWRKVQLRDLYCYVKNIERRQYFASLVQEISFEACDTILADSKLSCRLLDFSHLVNVNMQCSNIIGVRFANIQSLFVPSLRCFTIEQDDDNHEDESEEDVFTLLRALIPCRATLTALHFDVFRTGLAAPVLYELLDSMTALEDLQFGTIAEDMHRENVAEDLLQTLLDKPKLTALSFPHGVTFSLADISAFLSWMGHDWTTPSLTSFGRPRFDGCQAAADLIDRMPNLEELTIGLDDGMGLWSDNLKIFSTALSKCEQLRSVILHIDLDERDIDCSWLPYLTGLQKLEFVEITFAFEAAVTVTGTQLAAFLTGLPKLRDLSLDLNSVEVSCTSREKSIIDDAITRMKKVDLGSMTFVIQQ